MMKRRFALIVAVVFCCTIVLTSCTNPLSSLREFFNKKTAEKEMMEQPEKETISMSEIQQETPENTRPTVMYYKDGENLLVPVMRYIPKGDLGIAKSAISALVYSAESFENLKEAGLMPTLPRDTKVNGAVVKESGLAVVDLSKEFATFSSKEAEEIGIKSLLYTLTEFPNIKSVQLKIDGKSVDKLTHGTKINANLKRTEINLQTEANIGDKASKVMVYYQKKGSGNYTYFVPVTKLVSGYTNSAEAALNCLLEGPFAGSSLVSPFPEGTKLLGVRVKDGMAYVDFSNEILNTGGNKSTERAMIKAVTLTLREFSEITKVKIFVDGKTIENTDGIGANEYLDVPIFVNYFE